MAENEKNVTAEEISPEAACTCAEERNLRKTRVGTVVSTKMQNTIVVQIVDNVKHPKYGKVIKRTSKLIAEDSENKCNEGDKVLIMETRPLSKTKKWRLVEIIEKAK